MQPNSNTSLPATSTPAAAPTSSREAARNASWEKYYRQAERTAALLSQRPSYVSYPGLAEYYAAQTSAVYPQTLYSYPAETTDAKMDDPLPPGNEDVEIPGLGKSEEDEKQVESELPSQRELYMQHLKERQSQPQKTEDGATLARQAELVAQQLHSAHFVASQQYNTVINSGKSHQQIPGLDLHPTSTLSAGFKFGSSPGAASTGVPFLIKPAIPEKAKPPAPAYLAVSPPVPMIPPPPAEAPQTVAAAVTSVLGPESVKPVTEGTATTRKKRKFEKGPPVLPKPLDLTTEEEQKRQERSARFSRPTAAAPAPVTSEEPKHKTKLIGRCQKLEKSYFRLSGRPDPSVVRPEPVLERALERLVRLLRNKEVDYFYAVDQFKGMRQDCTVQQLQSEICVRIYEASARAHLEYGEIWEYNQCQSNLEMLYRIGIPGCRAEFAAYRILYQVLHINKGEAVLMNKTIRSLAVQDRAAPEVQHALQLTSALLRNDLREAFRLYARAPNLARALVDHVLEELRYKAARSFMHSIRLKERVETMMEELGFYCRERVKTEGQTQIPPGCTEPVYGGRANLEADPELACRNCIEWLKAHGAVCVEGDGGNVMDTRIDPDASRSSLCKAKAENAVAHGDPNLSMSYFLVK